MLIVRIVNQDVDRLLDHLAELGRFRTLRDPVSRLTGVERDLTPPQLHAVLWLHRDGAMPMATLALRIGCTRPTATGVVDRLHKLGLAERRQKEGDRRVVLADLTPEGQRTAARAHEAVRESVGMLLQALSAADRKKLVDIFGKLAGVVRAFAEQEEAEGAA